MRTEFPRTRFRLYRLVPLVSAFCLLIAGAPILGAFPAGENPPAPAARAPAPHMTLVFMAQHRMPEKLWGALFTALRANLPQLTAEIPDVDASPVLIRADALAHGDMPQEEITVYLRGDCEASPEAESFPGGVRLGWVIKAGKQIEPVIHVECTPIAQEISSRTEWMNRQQRDTAMADAMARVILHEWAHVAMQSAAHGRRGLTKAQFAVNDLLPGGGQAQASLREPR
jgi:hypothetical protein